LYTALSFYLSLQIHPKPGEDFSHKEVEKNGYQNPEHERDVERNSFPQHPGH
jgi:hypothetical protein